MAADATSVSIGQIIDLVRPVEAHGELSGALTGAAALGAADAGQLSFCSHEGEKALAAIQASRAGLVLCREGIAGIESLAVGRALLATPNPRLAFIRCLNRFFAPQPSWEIHPTAVLDASLSLPRRISIGPFAYVGPDVQIGEDTVLGQGVHLGPGCRIGSRVVMGPGVVVGFQGQSFERNEKGEQERFPQLGGVTIEDDVQIGANSAIMRGALEQTIIGQGANIGNLVNIGHNARIGRHAFVSAGAILCGSVRIGDFAWLAPHCTIRDHAVVGERATVGLGSVVIGNVADGVTVLGVPARPIKRV